MIQQKQKVLVLGTKTFAEEVADVISEIAGVEVAGFVENMDHSLCEKKLRGLPVYWVDKISELAKTHTAVCGLGTTKRHLFVEQVKKQGLNFSTLVHPSARISANSTLDEGVFVSSAVVVAAYSELGGHTSVNRGALIGHHTKIGSFVTVGPGANIAGNCQIGDCTYIGIGAIIIDHIKIGNNSVIGASSVVTKDVPDKVQVIGVPARIVKENIEGK
jgi:sugar O-acyltransferase (sialic acid O-acetyltransferase NeuD family)